MSAVQPPALSGEMWRGMVRGHTCAAIVLDGEVLTYVWTGVEFSTADALMGIREAIIFAWAMAERAQTESAERRVLIEHERAFRAAAIAARERVLRKAEEAEHVDSDLASAALCALGVEP